MESWRLEITYPLDSEIDENLIEQILEKETCASGAGFGYRDLVFEFDNKKKAQQATKKIRKVYNLKDLKIKVISYNGD